MQGLAGTIPLLEAARLSSTSFSHASNQCMVADFSEASLSQMARDQGVEPRSLASKANFGNRPYPVKW